MEYYKKEILSVLEPFHIGGKYLGWVFDEVICHCHHAFLLRTIILRFVKGGNEFRIYVRTSREGRLEIHFQRCEDDPFIIPIIKQIRKVFTGKPARLEQSIFFAALNGNFQRVTEKLLGLDLRALGLFFEISSRSASGGPTASTMKPASESTPSEMEFSVRIANLYFSVLQQKKGIRSERILEVISQSAGRNPYDYAAVEREVARLFGTAQVVEHHNLIRYLQEQLPFYQSELDYHLAPFEAVDDFRRTVWPKRSKRAFPYGAVDRYDAIIVVNFFLESWGVGDFLIMDTRPLETVDHSETFQVTDLVALYAGSPKIKGVYADLLCCLSENALLDKKVLIVDMNRPVWERPARADTDYFDLFVYSQYGRVFHEFNRDFDLRQFLANPKKGILFLIKRLQAATRWTIATASTTIEMPRTYNRIYLEDPVAYGWLSSLTAQVKPKIGIAANYPVNHSSGVKKGWSFENWMALIRMLDEASPGIQFVLLPVNIATFFELDPSLTEFDYQFRLFTALGSEVDILYLDPHVKRHVMENGFYHNQFDFSNVCLESLKAAIGLCDLVISLDSGPAHITSSLGVPVVSMISENGRYLYFKPFGKNANAMFKIFDDNGIHDSYLNINSILPKEVLRFIQDNRLMPEREKYCDRQVL